MTRGQKASEGDTRVAPNGYHYTRTKDRWRLTHHLVMEKHLGRALRENELVFFRDNNRTNLIASNLNIKEKGTVSLRRRKAALEEKIREAQAELDLVNQELKTT